jgi:hypothetical protein
MRAIQPQLPSDDDGLSSPRLRPLPFRTIGPARPAGGTRQADVRRGQIDARGVPHGRAWPAGFLIRRASVRWAYTGPTDSRRGMPTMTTLDLPYRKRPADLVRWLVRARLMPALALVVYLALVQFEVSKECRGGAFSSGFGAGFDGRRCHIVIRRIGSELEVRVPLPR